VVAVLLMRVRRQDRLAPLSGGIPREVDALSTLLLQARMEVSLQAPTMGCSVTDYQPIEKAGFRGWQGLGCAKASAVL